MNLQSQKSNAKSRDPDIVGAEAAMMRAAERARRRAIEAGSEIQKSLSTNLAEKSVQAAVAAIEIYNKPNFSYREESFAILMTNAWELLLKAKWVLNHADEEKSLYELVDSGAGKKITKKNRSGNPITHSISYLIKELFKNKKAGLEMGCRDNILVLIEIRDNAAHFFHKDLYLARRLLEVGTASLSNYLLLVRKWFQMDLSHYDFYLMPISFFHAFETIKPASTAHYTDQTKRLLAFIDSLEQKEPEQDSQQYVTLKFETSLVRGKDESAVEFRWTDDPNAPAMNLREEDVLKKYPMTYRNLVNKMRNRYDNFLENNKFHTLRKALDNEKKYSIERLLNPANPKSSKQRFYNSNILQEFDKHYNKKTG